MPSDYYCANRIVKRLFSQFAADEKALFLKIKTGFFRRIFSRHFYGVPVTQRVAHTYRLLYLYNK